MPHYRVVKRQGSGVSSFYCYSRGEMHFVPGEKGSEILGEDSANEIAADARSIYPESEITVVAVEETK